MAKKAAAVSYIPENLLPRGWRSQMSFSCCTPG